MPTFTRLIAATAISGIAALALPGVASATIYIDRATFSASLGASFTDSFGAAYGSGLSYRTDAAMSAVVGQTTFSSTGFANMNIIEAGRYCAGCNGSFLLGFDRTSYGSATGVFGVGIDFISRFAPYYTAFITYGDGLTQNVALGSEGFFGVTSAVAIKSIAFGLASGATTRLGSISIDNLTIGEALRAVGAVPEPATWAMMAIGVGLIGVAMRRRQKVSVRFVR